jgi:carbon-monoxide dehydrogenase small subunit
VDGQPTYSCSTLAIACRDKKILTIEGLATDGELHPLQKAFVEAGAVQCGFCTPGMIMMAKAFLDENPNPSRVEVREGLSGNLCRCTGYVKIIDAVMAAVEMIGKGGS